MKSTDLEDQENVEQAKPNALISFVSSEVYEQIDDCQTYDEAMRMLKALFVKQPSEIYARHMLSTTKQDASQTLQEFRKTLQNLAKFYNFRDVCAKEYRDDIMRDAFSHGIRQCLQENKKLTFDWAFETEVTL